MEKKCNVIQDKNKYNLDISPVISKIKMGLASMSHDKQFLKNRYGLIYCIMIVQACSGNQGDIVLSSLTIGLDSGTYVNITAYFYKGSKS